MLTTSLVGYYRGHDLLTAVPVVRPAPEGTLETAADEITPVAAPRMRVSRWATARSRRTVRLMVDGRPEVVALFAFLDARRGRLAPFWCPTWQADLALAADAASGAGTLTVRPAAYVTALYPDEARRHLAIPLPDRTLAVRRVSAAVDTGDGTAALTLESALPTLAQGYTRAATQVGFCTLVRLADDAVDVTWYRPTLAEVAFTVVELPRLCAETTIDAP